MKIIPRLIHVKFIKRYKRFFADVTLNKKKITTHCPNSGSMLGLLNENNDAWVSKSDNPKRKLKYTLEILNDKKIVSRCYRLCHASLLVRGSARTSHRWRSAFVYRNGARLDHWTAQALGCSWPGNGGGCQFRSLIRGAGRLPSYSLLGLTSLSQSGRPQSTMIACLEAVLSWMSFRLSYLLDLASASATIFCSVPSSRALRPRAISSITRAACSLFWIRCQ